jgi:hypothetical protein
VNGGQQRFWTHVSLLQTGAPAQIFKRAEQFVQSRSMAHIEQANCTLYDATIRFKQSRQTSKQRRFTTAVGAPEFQDVSRNDRKRQSVEQYLIRNRTSQVVYFDQ